MKKNEGATRSCSDRTQAIITTVNGRRPKRMVNVRHNQIDPSLREGVTKAVSPLEGVSETFTPLREGCSGMRHPFAG